MAIEIIIDGISDLNPNNPLAGGKRSEGDDHMRLTKRSILLSFPNILKPITSSEVELNILTGAVLTTAELNYLVNVTGPLQAQIDNPIIARTNLANVFTVLQTIRGSFQIQKILDQTVAGTDNEIQFLSVGSKNNGSTLRNINSVSPGFLELSRNNSFGSIASRVMCAGDGRVFLQNITNSAIVDLQATGSVEVTPSSGNKFTYNSVEVATLADTAALTQTATTMGTITAGNTISPPAGYTAAQTNFMVSISSTGSPPSAGDLVESFSCSVTSSGVTSGTVGYPGGTNIPILNYIAVGIK